MYKVRSDEYQPDWMTTAQYMSFCDAWGSDAYKKRREARRGGQGPGKHTGGSRSFIEWREKMARLRTIETPKYHELKSNAEHLHIETGSSIPIGAEEAAAALFFGSFGIFRSKP
ncbi:hypothetical protein M9H77_18436 [Catharanthus roseus]|uniref:Uncharacterized protein n=1 Tax=Catharanthus roseus TaxID=4058 RepID=A0ACC0B7G6_CATRO|nr:hypothetical protein M9H77_18436 [Catharanthus roseus]